MLALEEGTNTWRDEFKLVVSWGVTDAFLSLFSNRLSRER